MGAFTGGKATSDKLEVMDGFRRFILWEYPRAGWQYDVMVGLIICFIFLTPRDMFHDQPKASSIVMLRAENGADVYFFEPGLLAGVPEAERVSRAAGMLKARGKKHNVTTVEPIYDAEQDIIGYTAFTKP